MNNSTLSWEALKDTEQGILTQRSKIPEGWLVRILYTANEAGSTGASITFVPDPGHKWDGGSLP